MLKINGETPIPSPTSSSKMLLLCDLPIHLQYNWLLIAHFDIYTNTHISTRKCKFFCYILWPFVSQLTRYILDETSN